ncbi:MULTISPECIES: PilZ domain-containing protein [Qipengyuania]|uniref:PilZ domain-containing protein n=1 Tax=Qipengyuania soli TaxID=2782568 RepID=A0A7S8IUF1_9SPHN|nr:PilZ domain-containing protein [Qipengyuania soli]QPC98537.1 PilZ domain-containing protein [Qipengyuania soli]
MSSLETRNVVRDSLFLFADLAFDGRTEVVRAKVRNLSAGGMMAESGVAVASGDRVTAGLRNVGEVKGVVAWVQGIRFGIAFDREIDPILVRAANSAGTQGSEAPRHTRPVRTGRIFDNEHGVRSI